MPFLSQTTTADDDEYDIVIVGGGTAGCVLANRLSEDPTVQVLVLEAGLNRNDDVRLKAPGLFTATVANPEFDWKFETVPQNGLNGRIIDVARGKVLGGSSSINLGNLGNPGWDWDNFSPYLDKFVTSHPPSVETVKALNFGDLEPPVQGATGPIQASVMDANHPLHVAANETYRVLGLNLRSKPASGVGVGGYPCNGAVDPRTRERSHSGKEYLAAAAQRSNLHVVTDALVERVLLEASQGNDAVATGVQYRYRGNSHVVNARREVILCAGAIQSPQLLELSGIGGAPLLKAHDIPVIVENPFVGEHLQDHIFIGRSYETIDGIETGDVFRDPEVVAKAINAYQHSKTGPLAQPGACSFAYLAVPPLDEKTDALQHLIEKYLSKDTTSHLNHIHLPSVELQYNLTHRMLSDPNEASCFYFFQPLQTPLGTLHPGESPYALKEPGSWFSFVLGLSHPFSRGTVHITSSEPTQHPAIDFKYLSHPLDAQILARHVRFLETLVATEPLAAFVKPGGKRLPAGMPNATIEDAVEIIRHAGSTFYHQCGSCSMMARELGGVVDQRLVVYGTRNLRVCDASIFPIEPRGPIMACVYAAAEKGADLIKEDLGVANKSAINDKVLPP